MGLKYVIIFLVAIGSFSFTHHQKHPLYVSITDATYNANEKNVEIISKIFLDDLEAVLKKQYNISTDLFATPTEASKKIVLDYLQKHLQYTIDGKQVAYQMIGYERKKDACWVYVEMPNVTSIRNVSITNTILYDFTDKQMNLIHFTVGSTTKSHKFIHPDKAVSFGF